MCCRKGAEILWRVVKSTVVPAKAGTSNPANNGAIYCAPHCQGVSEPAIVSSTSAISPIVSCSAAAIRR